MRIVGGRFKGTKLAAPGADGGGRAHLRPTSDRVREALFNILEHGDFPPIDGARVLDLFAGTGALGLEALSRGAAFTVFIDDGPTARGLIRQNIEKLRVIGQTKLWRRDATRLGPCRGAPHEYVFLDPPYGAGLGERALISALDGAWIAKGAVVVLEERADTEIALPEGLERIETRHYGESQVIILRYMDDGSPGGEEDLG